MSGKSFPLSGTLAKYSINKILQTIMKESRSGCLTVSREEVTRRLYVREGMITYASSNVPEDRLGSIFVAQGTIDRGEVEETLEESLEQDLQLGMLLLVEGKITSQDLFLGVSAQVVSILERMRSWRKGDFEFDESGAPSEGTILLKLPLSIYLGARGGEKTAAAVKKDAAQEETLPPVEMPPSSKEPIIMPEPRSDEERPSPMELVDTVEWNSDTAGMPPEDAEGEEADPGPDADSGDKKSFEKQAGEWGEVTFPDESEREDQEKAKMISEIEFQVQEVRRRQDGDAFRLLGVKKGATREEIKEAYHYLARILHPDLRPAHLSESVSSEADDLYQKIAVAHEELTAAAEPADEQPAEEKPAEEKPAAGKDVSKTRSQHKFVKGERIKAPTRMMDQGENARQLYFRAKNKISKGNYWQAVDDLRQVVRKNPKRAEYRNLLGFCIMQTGRRLHEAEEHIREAVRLDPGNPDYLTNLGLVYKSGRFFTKAKDMFQQALLYDKKHLMARQELKNILKAAAQEKGSTTFWKKIFRG